VCIRAGAALLAALASLDTGRYRNICGLLPCSLVFSCATSVLSPCIQPRHMLLHSASSHAHARFALHVRAIMCMAA